MNNTTEDQWARYERVSYEALARHAMPEYFWRVALVVIEGSYALGQAEARFAGMKGLREATGILKNHLRKVIDEMKRAGMLVEREGEEGGVWVLELQPNAAAAWKVPLRWSPEEAPATRRALAEVREFSAHDPRQGVMEPIVRDGADFARAIFDAQREAAEGGQNLQHGQNGGRSHGDVTSGPKERSHGDVTGGKSEVTRRCNPEPFTEKSHGHVTCPIKLYKGCTVKELKGSIAPTAVPSGVTRPCDPVDTDAVAGAGGAAVADLEDAETVRREIAKSLAGAERKDAPAEYQAVSMNADLRLLIERMWQVIPDQKTSYPGAWVNRCKACERAMRSAVDKFLESPPKIKLSNWQWLRSKYVAEARRMGLAQQLSPEDRALKGWWGAVQRAVRSVVFGGMLS